MLNRDHPRGGAGQPPGEPDPNRWRRWQRLIKPTRTNPLQLVVERSPVEVVGPGRRPRIRSPEHPPRVRCKSRLPPPPVLAPEPPDREPNRCSNARPCHRRQRGRRARARPGWQPRLGLRLPPPAAPCPKSQLTAFLSSVEAESGLESSGWMPAADPSRAGCWRSAQERGHLVFRGHSPVICATKTGAS